MLSRRMLIWHMPFDTSFHAVNVEIYFDIKKCKAELGLK